MPNHVKIRVCFSSPLLFNYCASIELIAFNFIKTLDCLLCGFVRLIFKIPIHPPLGLHIHISGSSIKGFMQYIRPVIVVDGTYLKGLYRGSIFVATCFDGNNQLYPLAIRIMDSENNDAWE